MNELMMHVDNDCPHKRVKEFKNDDHRKTVCLECGELIDYCITYKGWLTRGGREWKI